MCVCPLRRRFTKKCSVSHDRVSEQKIGIIMNKLSFEEGMLNLLRGTRRSPWLERNDFSSDEKLKIYW